MTKVTIAATGLALAVAMAASAQDATKASPRPAFPQPDLSKEPTLYVVGYAHLDTQWRWTYVDTIREYIPNTLHDNFKLFEKYPHYVFNFSGSRRYKMMEEYYPADFAKLHEAIASGRWFPCGSSVDENDANVPNGESLVRHVLYGNRYFRAHFGVASDEFMLPDCFGFPAALPSALAHCGIKGFSTQKLTWNAVVPIPFKVGVWQGPDGHSVIAALDPGAYVGQVKENLATSNGWTQRIKANGEKSGVYVDYHYFGTGDTGGAPDAASVAKVEESVNTKDGLHVICGPADLMYNAITAAERERLPRYQGELMLTEHSAGSITSQAYMKRWNRKNELLADAAERASVAARWLGARSYPAERFEDAWYLILGSQMHDILPGTSVPKAYDFSWNDEVIAGNELASTLTDAASPIIASLDTKGEGQAVVVYNPLSAERTDVVEFPFPPAARGAAKDATAFAMRGTDGKDIPAQLVGTGDSAKLVFVAPLPPLSFTHFDLVAAKTPGANPNLKVSERELENEVYRVRLDEHGDLVSVMDKEAKRELLSGPVRLGLHYENPKNWPAWNQDWADRQLPAKSYAGAEGPVRFRVVETGPARVAVEVTREAEGSTFRQVISLAAGNTGAARRIEFDTDVDWLTRERSLRAAFPLAVSNPMATYDIQIGTVERPNSHEKQFEYSFHKWFDLTDTSGAYGVSVLCDSKYGSDKPDDHTVRLTLLHTPGTRGGYPDQGTQDLGRHHVRYALLGHQGDWRKGQTFAQGDALNQPPIPFLTASHGGPLGKSFSIGHLSSPAVSVSALKAAEDGSEVVVRLREHTGQAQKGVRLAMSRPIVAAREIDGQERALGPATLEKGELVADMGGFELRAYALTLGDPPAQRTAPTSQSVALAYDADVVSTNAKRSDGAFDDAGGSYPAEQFPTSLAFDGSTFAFGPTTDGATNAMTCRGQELALPSGEFDRLYLVCASVGDVPATLGVGGSKVPFTSQHWTGYVGQWDRRVWPGEVTERSPGSGDIVGLEPGFVKPAPIAWNCSHHHTPKGDALYEYSYLFAYPFELPKGTTTVRLPDDPRIKVFAATVARRGEPTVTAARPLFDTLSDHRQDAPRITPAGGTFRNATEVRIERNLYGREGAIRYTIDGSDPTSQSTAYTGPFVLPAAATVKAAVLANDGTVGPIQAARIEVNDTTPPSLAGIDAGFESPVVKVRFSEPLAVSAADPSHFAIEPKLGIEKVVLADGGRSAVLTLAKAPATGTDYRLSISGIRDASPGGNAVKSLAGSFAIAARPSPAPPTSRSRAATRGPSTCSSAVTSSRRTGPSSPASAVASRPTAVGPATSPSSPTASSSGATTRTCRRGRRSASTRGRCSPRPTTARCFASIRTPSRSASGR